MPRTEDGAADQVAVATGGFLVGCQELLVFLPEGSQVGLCDVLKPALGGGVDVLLVEHDYSPRNLAGRFPMKQIRWVGREQAT